MEENIYTHLELTQKRYTQKQAYEHAAMLIRTKAGLSLAESRQLFPKGTYSEETEPSLTLFGFGHLVKNIVRMYR